MSEISEKLVIPKKVSKFELASLEKRLDKLFSKFDIDVEFSNHFHDRLNDARNKKQITVDELSALFNDTFKKYGKHIAGMADDDEAVLVDVSSSINVPFVINIEKDGMEMVSKTIMRKKGFKTRTRRLVMDIYERLDTLELRVAEAKTLTERNKSPIDQIIELQAALKKTMYDLDEKVQSVYRNADDDTKEMLVDFTKKHLKPTKKAVNDLNIRDFL